MHRSHAPAWIESTVFHRKEQLTHLMRPLRLNRGREHVSGNGNQFERFPKWRGFLKWREAA